MRCKCINSEEVINFFVYGSFKDWGPASAPPQGTAIWQDVKSLTVLIPHNHQGRGAGLQGSTETPLQGRENAVWDVGKPELIRGPWAWDKAHAMGVLKLLNIQEPLEVVLLHGTADSCLPKSR